MGTATGPRGLQHAIDGLFARGGHSGWGSQGRIGEAVRRLPSGMRSRSAHRARWGIVDQALSSLTNFAIAAVVAHQVTPAEFGSFSITLTVYIFLLWVARSVVGEPFVVRMTDIDASSRTEATRAALGAAVVLGAGAGLAMVIAGLLLGSEIGSPLVAMAVFMPGLLAQDTYRFVLMTTGRLRAVAANDAIWLGLQTALFMVLAAVGNARAVSLTAAFGVSATLAGLAAWRQVGAAPSVGSWWKWLRAHCDLGIPFVLELVTVNGASQLSMLGVAALGGVVAAGELRTGALLFSAPSVLCSGLYVFGVPEAVRMRRHSLRRLTILVLLLAVAMSLSVVLWTAGLLLVPSGVGEALLKSNWAHGRSIVLPMAALTAGSSAVLAAIVGLRALEAARQSLRARVWAGPVILVSGVIGAAADGAYGAAIGLAVSSWLSALLAFIVFRRALSDERIRLSGGRQCDQPHAEIALPVGLQ